MTVITAAHTVAVSAAIILALLLIYLWMIFPSVRRRDISFLFSPPIAHRALHDKDGICENSIEAVRAALELSLPIEIDVRQTRDGVPVVIHDDSLLRLCGVPRRVSEMTLEELSHCRLLEGNSRIPTLSEVLTEAGGKVPLLIELKSAYRSSIAEATAKCLENYTGRVAVQSFDPFCLRRFGKLMPRVPRGFLAAYAKLPCRPHVFAASRLITNFLCRPDFISYGYSEKYPPALCVLKLLTCPSLTWTITSSKQASVAASRFDGIIAEQISEIMPKRDA